MFLEIYKPTHIDIYRTADRVKLRVGESEDGRFWVNLTFDNQGEADKFVADLKAKLKV